MKNISATSVKSFELFIYIHGIGAKFRELSALYAAFASSSKCIIFLEKKNVPNRTR